MPLERSWSPARRDAALHELVRAHDAAASEDVDMQEPSAVAPRMTWDERRALTLDILNLAPPDKAGALLLLHGGHAPVAIQEFPPDDISAWDEQADAVGAERLPPVALHPLQMELTFDLDHASADVLQQLRRYVDNCFVPHYVPKENCMICEGLWSNGRVIACGNDDCETRVHEECFGMVLREDPDGPWFCPSCLFGRPLSCSVCMQLGGALKPLVASANAKDNSDGEQKWVHVLCALAIPELVMRDVPTMEPVEGFEEIENGRFRYLCGICRKRGGASMICEQENCNVGMHPLCAANAGFMIGNEAKPLAIYCEKHLPSARIPGAKRWISDEDLVEEIMSEYSVDNEDADNTSDAVEFILESTAAIRAHSKLLGSVSTLRWGATPKPTAASRDLRPSALASVRINPHGWTAPGTVPMAVRTGKPLVFPPQPVARVGLPAFPQGDALLGAVIDYLAKDQDDWSRAQVVEWDATRSLHLVHLIASGQKLWATLSPSNALLLHLPGEHNDVDGQRVRLYRPVRRGVAEWRPRPRLFGPATEAS
ncbi:hypothetical protein P43SY_000397 [Pythium insidiosum]|uniref:PHD-type domain-containing protein n=1 Tax=Pythium insidiosum TaxID=114742 RepID=A0AAD5LQI3_PYTIN|nr:hypothetical protein P43SY_000397 [Pythium insidiosum]